MASERAESDQQIIDRILAGERELYAELVDRAQSLVRQLCLSMLSDPQQAEDAAQDAFIKAYASLKNFRGQSAFSTWVYRIAANRCLDILRQRTRRKEESWERMVDDRGDAAETLLAPSGAKDVGLEDRELIERLLSSMRPEERLVLTLREVQGLTYQEMMKLLDCSLDAVKSRLKRARANLQERARHFFQKEGVQIDAGGQ